MISMLDHHSFERPVKMYDKTVVWNTSDVLICNNTKQVAETEIAGLNTLFFRIWWQDWLNQVHGAGFRMEAHWFSVDKAVFFCPLGAGHNQIAARWQVAFPVYCCCDMYKSFPCWCPKRYLYLQLWYSAVSFYTFQHLYSTGCHLLKLKL
jgi:hypothetical protein